MPSRAMLNILRSLVGAARSFFKTQKSLALENLALRHQVGVLKRTVGNRRPKLGIADRGLWATLSRVFGGWEQALAIVQPATVIGWHRAGFKRFWTRKSRAGTSGRPALDREIRNLIRRISQSNPTWGSPRVRNELAKLGIELSRATVAKYRVRRRFGAESHRHRPGEASWKATSRTWSRSTSSRSPLPHSGFCSSCSFCHTIAVGLCTST